MTTSAEPRGGRSHASGAVALVVGLVLAIGSVACSSSQTINDAGGAGASPDGSFGSPGSLAGDPTSSAAWTTYHHDAARTGVDPTSPAAGKLTRSWSRDLDGIVYAEPLVVGSTVYVATEDNTVYALDRASGKVRWSRHLATPVAGDALPCGNIDPSGITGTPVVDPATGTLYVVGFESTRHHTLFALRLTDGSVEWSRPADPTGADPSVEQQRGALSIAAGQVIVPYGGLYGDCGNYHGFLLGFPLSGQGQITSFQVPNERQAGIWAPPGATTAPDGSLLVATGNGTSTDAFRDSDSVIRLSPSLRPLDVFAPTSWARLNRQDLDLGTTSPAVVGGKLVLQVGKEGIGYLLELDHLGGVGGAVDSGRVCGSAYGGTAVAGSIVYVACLDGLYAVHIRSGAHPTFTAERATDVRVGPPILSGGVVWVVTNASDLEGFDQLSGRLRYRFHLDEVVTSFPSLAAAGGSLYVPAGESIVCYRGV